MTVSTEQDTAAEATPTIRSILRDTTAEAHRQVDQRLSALDLSNEADYRAFLRAQALALIPLENALEAAGISYIFPDWPERSRREALRADLRALGETVTPLPLRLRDVGEAALTGILYTLEGSRLGARYILKAMMRDGDTSLPCAFLRHGEGNGLWGRFCSALETTPAIRSGISRTVEGALFAFAVFDRAAEDLPAKSGVN